MDCHPNETAGKLMLAFRHLQFQFHRGDWHQRTIAGCTAGEIRVLFCIYRGLQLQPTEMKVSGISKLLNVTAPSITQAIKGLEAKGLVERADDPTDRRSVHITLTVKGEQVVQQAIDHYAALIHGLVEYLGAEQSAQLADLLTRATHYFDERASSAHNTIWSEEEVTV
jgi:DNA-binding MarR family transcriptional regulator